MAVSDTKRTVEGYQILKTLRLGLLVVAGLIAISSLIFFAPNLVTPVARFNYEDGFERAVTIALKAVPNSANACIYDDSRNIFVTSIDRLDTGRMIEKAVRDRMPRPRPNGLQRDPHFRVLANGKTYYWSFHDSRLYPFPPGNWSLEGESARMCSAYMQSPKSYKELFLSLYGIAVTAENFCCGLEAQP